MTVHKIRKGLELPITGAPEQVVHDGNPVTRVALVADDYPFMKPRMHVAVGDTVKRGQPLFEDRKGEGVVFTALAAGTVVAIDRGAKRALQSLTIELSDDERAGTPGDDAFHAFESYTGTDPGELDGDAVRGLLLDSGLWTALRQRPYSRVPDATATATSVFVTAIDSNPYAADPAVVLKGQEADFERGLRAVSKLTEGPTFLCKAQGAAIPGGSVAGVRVEEFAGKHPSGLVGTHIHMLDPVSRSRSVFHLGYQDVLAIGKLFGTGRLDVTRVVGFGGPVVAKPRLLKTRIGASIVELCAGETSDVETRLISGSVFCGRNATDGPKAFLGRYHTLVSALAEDRERVFLGWTKPGFDKFSVTNAFAGQMLGVSGSKKYAFGTSTHGSHRAMVPIGMFEKVMPLDILPTFLLRSLLVDDLERAEALGALELDEEDLALCSFVSPGKEDYGVALRRNLTTIWKEG